jgi:hypothetical protein
MDLGTRMTPILADGHGFSHRYLKTVTTLHISRLKTVTVTENFFGRAGSVNYAVGLCFASSAFSLGSPISASCLRRIPALSLTRASPGWLAENYFFSSSIHFSNMAAL